MRKRQVILAAMWVFVSMVSVRAVQAGTPPGEGFYFRKAWDLDGLYADIAVERPFANLDPDGAYIQNGAFDMWPADELPTGWTLYSYERVGKELHWAQVDLSMADGQPNYALGLFVRNIHRRYAPIYGAACTLLNVSIADDYWVSVHTSAWGIETIPYNSVAWYAITTSKNPRDVEFFEWRELSADLLSCRNGDEKCAFVARKETVYIEPNSYLCVRAGMKFREYNAWTMWVWDDISITDATGGYGVNNFIAAGTLTWKRYALR